MLIWILVITGLIVLGVTIVVAVRDRVTPSGPPQRGGPPPPTLASRSLGEETPSAPDAIDPLFAAGIALAGAGAALTATLGAPGIGILGAATALLIIGIVRTRRRGS